MKSVLISTQPYWVFLIIAKAMGWDIPQEKTVEVRKTFPKDPKWDRKAIIYCGRNMKSFRRIPKQYQPFMKRLLGKVVGEFVCDKIVWNRAYLIKEDMEQRLEGTCLTNKQLYDYVKMKDEVKHEFFTWHISDLKIYDIPRGLSEFYKKCEAIRCEGCEHLKYQMVNSQEYDYDCEYLNCKIPLTRPPQSWCYVEGV